MFHADDLCKFWPKGGTVDAAPMLFPTTPPSAMEKTSLLHSLPESIALFLHDAHEVPLDFGSRPQSGFLFRLGTPSD